MQNWEGPESGLSTYLEKSCAEILDAYKARPQLVAEHYRIERAVAEGGYGHRQVYELVQNGADALLRAQQSTGKSLMTQPQKGAVG